MIAKQLEDEAVQKDLDNISLGSSSDEKEDPVQSEHADGFDL